MRRTGLKRFLYYLPERLLLLSGRKYHIDGVKLVISLQEPQAAELILSKVTAALGLIQQYAPKSYARIKRFTPNILVFGGHSYTAVYVSDLRLCSMDRSFARSEQTTPAGLASILIHEATHGYLDSLGINYDEQLRKRIERICVLAEISFARRLPEPENLIEKAVNQLVIGTEFWTNEAFAQRDLETLAALDAPPWLVAFLKKKVAARAEKRDR